MTPDPAARLRDAVESATPRLTALSDADAAAPPAPGKWSPKEVIGHLIDSASNNHGRFVRAQFSDDFVFPGYEQERWVEAQRYRDAPWSDLVALWRAFNLHLAHVMAVTPDDERRRPRANHNLDQIAFHHVPASEPMTVEQYMHDYIDHLEHHLRQIRP